MKRFISIFIALVLSSTFIFAQAYDDGDEYDDGYVYESNGKGDQFLKLNMGVLIPNNFGGSPRNKENPGQLYTGIVAEVGYFRFLNKSFALGGELDATYNLSIGDKALIMVPITFGALYQPTIAKFEFPNYLLVGLGYEAWQNTDFFPSLVLKASSGIFYRINDAASVGGSASFTMVNEFSKAGYDKGMFTGVTIGARYHF
ncbi:MAG: hypothetical protein MJ188_03335 [Treponema sp.]|nr:hypothetical protein [Treponema sp.]